MVRAIAVSRLVLAALPVCVALTISVRASALEAGWVADGAAICTATGSQAGPSVVQDEAGGAIIAWYDSRNGNLDIYAQRIGALGSVQWTADGVAVSATAGDQVYPAIASDGAGGAIIAWYDSRSGNGDIYAQRVSASGLAQWTVNGVAVCTASGHQGSAVVASDGAGGAIIAWYDPRGGNGDIYAQRVNASGLAQWTVNGVAVCTASGYQQSPVIMPDGAGGAIIAWYDPRGGSSDIYAQRINSLGGVQWTGDGVAVCTAVSNQEAPVIIPDGAGGAVITWYDARSGSSYDIYAQRISALGGVQWTGDGVAVSAPAGDQVYPAIASDGAGGAIITWYDFRSGSSDIYAQRVNASGGVQWAPDGVAVCTAAGYQQSPVIIPDGAAGAIIAWQDARSGSYDIYAQRVNASGAVQWTMNGIAVCVAASSQQSVKIVSDGSGGAVIAWTNGDDYDIYAQRVTATGDIDTPKMRGVTDVPGDQGGWLRLRVGAAMRDAQGVNVWPVTGYNIWRRVEGADGAAPGGYEGSRATLPGGILRTSGQELVGMRLTSEQAVLAGFPVGEWESIGFHAAIQDTEYCFVAPAKDDSTVSGAMREVFVVSAHTTTPSVYFVSKPDSGSSSDNLSPGPPAGLAGDYSYPPAQLLVTWLANSESDLSHYAVYKGDHEGFAPSESNRIGVQTDTFFVDTSFDPNESNYYKVSAWDVHENESGYALLTPDELSGVGGAPNLPVVTALEQNYPNPFNPMTTIGYHVPAPGGRVTIRVYDVAGGLVRTLVDAPQAPGRRSVTWDGRSEDGGAVATGVYIYRMTSSGFEQTLKMVILK